MENTQYVDKTIICKGVPGEPCGKEFVFTAGGQAFFAEKGYSDPTRCKPCRAKMKAIKEKKQREQGGEY